MSSNQLAGSVAWRKAHRCSDCAEACYKHDGTAINPRSAADIRCFKPLPKGDPLYITRAKVKQLRAWLRKLLGPVSDYVDSVANCGDEQEEVRLLRTLDRWIDQALDGKPVTKEVHE